jgi:preprotein translocase SecE subunit
MTKKTSKQGKKANKNSAQKATEVPVKLSAAEKKAAEKMAAEQKAAEQKAAEKKAAEKKAVEKSEKDGKSKQQSTKTHQKASKSAKQAPKKDNIFRKALTYFKNVRLEIKRTTWPTRNEVFRMSLIVIGALLFFGVLIFFFDWVMTRLLELYASVRPSSSETLQLLGL